MRPNQYPTLNFDLGETADLLRDSVMSFAADAIAPRAAEIDQSNEFPAELWLQMGACEGTYNNNYNIYVVSYYILIHI